MLNLYFYFIFQEIKLDDVKNPMVKLNEIALTMKKPIKYKTISISGAMHAPVFTICVSCGDYVGNEFTFIFGN